MNAAELLQPVTSALTALAWLAGAYLVGSIPEAWLLAWALVGTDLRQMGSGNVGVMNTAVSVARWAGLLVFLSEIIKGVLAVWIPRSAGASEMIIDLCVLGVVTGIRWPVWLRFKGGRGNTAGMAAIPLISYPAAAAALAFWVLCRLLLNNSYKATRMTILVMPFIAGLVSRSAPFFFTMLALSLIYLFAQHPESDDHSLIKERWSSFYGFLVSPPRKGRRLH